MRLGDAYKQFSTFRAQLVVFIVAMLALAMVALSLVNQQLENRTTRVVDEYIRSIPLATGLVFRSLFKGENLYDLVNLPDPDSLAINSESSIQQILIVDSEGKVFDSTDKKDIGTLYKPKDKDSPIGMGNLKNELNEIGARQSQTLNFSLTTAVEDAETGARKDVEKKLQMVIPLKCLQRVKGGGDSFRFFFFLFLFLLLLGPFAIFKKRFPRRWAPGRQVG